MCCRESCKGDILLFGLVAEKRISVLMPSFLLPCALMYCTHTSVELLFWSQLR